MAKTSEQKKVHQPSPIAFIAACFWAVPGILIGQDLGIMIFGINYAFLGAISGGLLLGLSSYIVNFSHNNTSVKLYSKLGTAVSAALGSILTLVILVPAMLLLALTLPTTAELALLIAIGSIVPAVISYFSNLLVNPANRLLDKLNSFLRKVPFINKLVAILSPNGLKLSHHYNFTVASSIFITMLLSACFGAISGPAGWIKGLFAGLIFGTTVTAPVAHYFTKNSHDLAKILASLYAISGTIIGLMSGAVMASALTWAFPAVALSTYLCCAVMATVSGLGGAAVGLKIGNKPEYKKFDLNNPHLRHKLYQAALIVPLIFVGYLTGASVGVILYPGLPILLFQGIGTLVFSIGYIGTVAGYYVVRDGFFPSYTTDFPSGNNNDPGVQQSPPAVLNVDLDWHPPLALAEPETPSVPGVAGPSAGCSAPGAVSGISESSQGPAANDLSDPAPAAAASDQRNKARPWASTSGNTRR